jgi:membrane-associated phospholipid phosphatase
MRLPIEALKLAALSLASFLTVTVFRHLFNAPRPYELYEFYENKPRKKYGKSFPSRHVFSAFIIATIAFNYSLPLGIALSIMSFFLAVSRVLLGIHFVRDVCAGALIGAISGVIEILILNYH